MLKKLVVVMILAFSSSAIFAEDEKPVAPKEVVSAALEQCKQYAAEDGIKEEEMDNYLLDCVNDELEEQGYQKLDKLEKE